MPIFSNLAAKIDLYIIIHRMPFYGVLHVKNLRAGYVCNDNATNLGSAFSIIHFVVGGMNIQTCLGHKVLSFALSRLKGVVCEAIHQLQHKLNRCLYAYKGEVVLCR